MDHRNRQRYHERQMTVTCARFAYAALLALLCSGIALGQTSRAKAPPSVPVRSIPVTLSPFGPNSYSSMIQYLSDPTQPDGGRGVPTLTLRIVLRGTGFQSDSPSDNVIWIDGTRVSIKWDGCSSLPAGAVEKPVSAQVHGEVMNPDALVLCGVAVPPGNQLKIAAGYNESISSYQTLQVASLSREVFAIYAGTPLAFVVLLPIFMLRFGKQSTSWTALLRDAHSGAYSLSRLQLYLWTLVILFAFAYAYSCRKFFLGGGVPEIPTSVLALLGITSATMLLIMLVAQAGGPDAQRSPSLADFITHDGSVAPDRLQFFIWTLLGTAFYYLSVLGPRPEVMVNLPSPPNWFLALTGISSAGYIAGRVLRARTTPAVQPAAVTLANPGFRDIERLRAERKRIEEEQFNRNLPDVFLVRSFEWADVRFFEDGIYTFAPRVNVLLGKNGYGKSLLFRTLAAMIQGDLDHSAMLFRADRANAEKPDSSRPGSEAGPRLKLTVDRNGKSENTLRDPEYFGETAGKIPLLAIPDSRFVNRAIRGVTPSPVPSRLSRNGARNFLTQEPFENVVVDLLAKLGLDHERNRTFDQPLYRLIERVVRELTEDEKFAFYSIERGEDSAFEILVKTAGNEDRPLPIQNASQGTLSVLAIFGLIYTFLQSLRPNLKADAVPSAAGIVLIDELDAHLHPRWQQRIMGLLTSTFPNVQFIVSAHSPLIVAGCDRNEVAVLRRDDVADRFVFKPIERDFLGIDAAELYRTIFDIEDVDRLYLEYSAKAASGVLEAVQSEIARLESKSNRTAKEEADLDRLWQEQRLIGKAAKVREKKLASETTQAQIERLQNEVQRLSGLLAKGQGNQA